MNEFSTEGGRLFFVAVEGGGQTLQDTMVAAPLYLRTLEEQFENAQQLRACFWAWRDHAPKGLETLSEPQRNQVKKWLAAHHAADRVARPFLSNPVAMSFALRVSHKG